jgi:hypothetical protein
MLLRENNYRALEEFLDLMIGTFDITEDAGMLSIVLPQNNQRLCMRSGLMGSRPDG